MGHLVVGRVVRGLEGDYHVERQLAKTHHHALFVARGPSGDDVLLKELHTSDIHDWEDVERLRAEARLLADIRHPRVPAFVELFATDGTAPQCADHFALAASSSATAAERPETLPSLVLARRWIAGETIEEGATRARPLASTQIEDALRDLLDLTATLHGMVPGIVHGEIDPSRVVLDAAGRAHLIGFGAAALRRQREPSTGALPAATPMDDARGVGRVVERLVGKGDLSRSGLSSGAIAVLRALRAEGPNAPTAKVALAMLTNGTTSMLVRRIRNSRVTRGIALAAISVTVHGVILASVLRATTRRAHAAKPMAVPSFQPARVDPPMVPPPTPPAVQQPSPPLVFWSGTVLESGGSRSVPKGAPCVMTADVSGNPESAFCSISLTCGGEVYLQDEIASPCEVVEQPLSSDTYQYALKASHVGKPLGVSLRVDHGSAFVLTGENRLHVKLAPTSSPQRAGRPRMDPASLPISAPSVYEGVAVEAQGEPSVHLGDHCSVRFTPVADDPRKNCHVKVECRGNVLYDKSSRCSSDGTSVRDYFDDYGSLFDGDESFSWSEHIVTLEDITPTARKHVELYLHDGKPIEDDHH